MLFSSSSRDGHVTARLRIVSSPSFKVYLTTEGCGTKTCIKCETSDFRHCIVEVWLLCVVTQAIHHCIVEVWLLCVVTQAIRHCIVEVWLLCVVTQARSVCQRRFGAAYWSHL